MDFYFWSRINFKPKKSNAREHKQVESAEQFLIKVSDIDDICGTFIHLTYFLSVENWAPPGKDKNESILIDEIINQTEINYDPNNNKQVNYCSSFFQQTEAGELRFFIKKRKTASIITLRVWPRNEENKATAAATKKKA